MYCARVNKRLAELGHKGKYREKKSIKNHQDQNRDQNRVHHHQVQVREVVVAVVVVVDAVIQDEVIQDEANQAEVTRDADLAVKAVVKAEGLVGGEVAMVEINAAALVEEGVHFREGEEGVHGEDKFKYPA